MYRKDLRKGQIPREAIVNGDFVIDIGNVAGYLFSDPDEVERNQILTAGNIRDLGIDRRLQDHYFPVYDALDGRSIGKMTAKDFMRKIL